MLVKVQYDKSLEIIKTFKNNKLPFTWCVVSNSQELNEKEYFLSQGFTHSETMVAMMIDLNSFNKSIILNENEKIHQVKTFDDIEKFRNIIKSAFSLSLIDLQKYYGIYELRKKQKLSYQVYLTVDDIPASTGHFYYEKDLVIIDDISTNPIFQKQGLAKKIIIHLLQHAKNLGYEQATLIASVKGFKLYEKLGFKPLDLYFDVYELNY